MRIIWKGFAAISINKIGGLPHHLSTFETPTAATVRGFLFNVRYIGVTYPLFVPLSYAFFLTPPNNNPLIFKYLQLYTPAMQQNTRIEHDYIASDSLGKKFEEKRQNSCKCLKYVLYLRCD